MCTENQRDAQCYRVVSLYIIEQPDTWNFHTHRDRKFYHLFRALFNNTHDRIEIVAF